MNQENTTTEKLPGRVVGALADAFGKSFLTIERWIKNNDIILTTDIAKQVFAEYGIDWNAKSTKH